MSPWLKGLLLAGGAILVAGATAVAVTAFHENKEIHKTNKKFRIFPLLSDEEVA
jgi:hypothetical protein